MLILHLTAPTRRALPQPARPLNKEACWVDRAGIAHAAYPASAFFQVESGLDRAGRGVTMQIVDLPGLVWPAQQSAKMMAKALATAVNKRPVTPIVKPTHTVSYQAFKRQFYAATCPYATPITAK